MGSFSRCSSASPGYLARPITPFRASTTAAARSTIDGTVSQFQLINPHPILIVDVRDSAGTVQQWRGEMDNRSELVAIGVTANTFTPGDRVVVKGSLARTQSQSLYILRLDRPMDGFWYEQVGSSPRISEKLKVESGK